jgi:hypothetical protein
LGLWDVLENCERKGSLDVHIIKRKWFSISIQGVTFKKNNF